MVESEEGEYDIGIEEAFTSFFNSEKFPLHENAAQTLKDLQKSGNRSLENVLYTLVDGYGIAILGTLVINRSPFIKQVEGTIGKVALRTSLDVAAQQEINGIRIQTIRFNYMTPTEDSRQEWIGLLYKQRTLEKLQKDLRRRTSPPTFYENRYRR